MNFLKRFYDKVILLVLLILFVGLMFYVLGIVDRAESVAQKDLELKTPRPDDNLGNKKDSDFPYAELWKESRFFWKGNGESDVTSDLIVAEQLAECPFCSKESADAGNSGKLLVPLKAFGAACPNSVARNKLNSSYQVHQLPKPQTAEELALAGSAGGFDSDGDGISDVDEEKYRMDKNDKSDALLDNDGDGFSNRFEISKETDPNDYTSCPPLWHRLKVAKIDTIILPVQLLNVDTSPRKGKDAPKDQWIAFCKEPTYNRRRKQWSLRDKEVMIGSRMLVEYDLNTRYRVVDMIKEVDPQTKAVKFRVELEEVLARDQKKLTPRKVTMISGEPVKSKDSRPIIKDTGRPGSEDIVRRIGARFTINRHPDPKIDKYFEEYEVVSYDDKLITVELRRTSGSEESFTITHEGEIPKNDEVVSRHGQD